jgi:hypothetical protein
VIILGGGDQWKVIKLPALASEPNDPVMGERDFSALFQQNPISDTGSATAKLERAPFFDEGPVAFAPRKSLSLSRGQLAHRAPYTGENAVARKVQPNARLHRAREDHIV